MLPWTQRCCLHEKRTQKLCHLDPQIRNLPAVEVSLVVGAAKEAESFMNKADKRNLRPQISIEVLDEIAVNLMVISEFTLVRLRLLFDPSTEISVFICV